MFNILMKSTFYLKKFLIEIRVHCASNEARMRDRK